MDKLPINSKVNLFTPKCADGINEFMILSQRRPETKKLHKLKYTCSTYRNNSNIEIEEVWKHLYIN